MKKKIVKLPVNQFKKRMKLPRTSETIADLIDLPSRKSPSSIRKALSGPSGTPLLDRLRAKGIVGATEKLSPSQLLARLRNPKSAKVGKGILQRLAGGFKNMLKKASYRRDMAVKLAALYVLSELQ